MQFKLTQYWYRPSLHFFTCCLLPLSWLFGCITSIRRCLYRIKFFKTHYFNVPIIVVGNISVGGTGKTPFVIWLANYLQSQGFHPGIVSRGVGGISHKKPHQVCLNDTAAQVGDEAILLLKQTGLPIVIGIDRVAAVQQLLMNSPCDVVISDDGLQHYRLGRDVNIVMVDAERGFGNRRLLPAGPLREKIASLHKHDFVIEKDGDENNLYSIQYEPAYFVSVINPNKTLALHEFPEKNVHALAGIGYPEKFFKQLTLAGFNVTPHIFPDHHLYQPSEIIFDDNLPVFMTEKDAVKCTTFVDEKYWYLKINIKIKASLAQQIVTKLKIRGSYEKNHSN